MIERGTPGSLGRLNRRLILTHLLDHGPCSRADLAKRLAMSSPAVGTNIRDLLESGLVTEEGFGNTNKVGRNSILLKVNAAACAVMGVHLELDELRVAVSDLVGTVTHVDAVRHPVHRTVAAVVEDVDKAVERAEERLPGLRARLKVLALGVHGIKSEKKSKNYLHLLRDMTDLEEALAGRLGIEVVVDNDVNMAVLGETWQVLGSRYRDIVFVNIERGIGAGIVLDNRLYRGWRNASGEIGHMLVRQTQCAESYGREGALENLLLPKLGRRGAARVGTCPPDLVEPAAMMLVNIACILNPQIIILGGSVGARLMGCRDQILSVMERHLPTEAPEIELSRTGDLATVYGAIRVGLDQAREGVFASL